MSTQAQQTPPLKKLGQDFSKSWNQISGLLPIWGWALIWLGVVGLYGWFGQDLGFLFLNGNFYGSIITTLAYVMMALGLNVVVGFAGLLDLGYVAFYAIGALVAGWFASGHFEGSTIYFLEPVKKTLSGKEQVGIHINFFLVIFIAAAITAAWGAMLGAPTLRLRGDYLAIVTLAFGEIVPRVFELSTSGPFGIGHLDLSNGREGITPVDTPHLPGLFQNVSRVDLKGFYFIALLMLLLVLLVNFTLRDSRLGRAWIAVREDEVAAAAMGVPLVRVKLWAYAIGAATGGFSGVFLGAYNNVVNVDQFEFQFSVFILCMVILGGMGNLAGVILGAVTLSMINIYLLPNLGDWTGHVGIHIDFAAIAGGVFGFGLLVMMLLRPQGFIPNRRRKLELVEDDMTDDTSLGAMRV